MAGDLSREKLLEIRLADMTTSASGETNLRELAASAVAELCDDDLLPIAASVTATLSIARAYGQEPETSEDGGLPLFTLAHGISVREFVKAVDRLAFERLDARVLKTVAQGARGRKQRSNPRAPVDEARDALAAFRSERRKHLYRRLRELHAALRAGEIPATVTVASPPARPTTMLTWTSPQSSCVAEVESSGAVAQEESLSDAEKITASERFRWPGGGSPKASKTFPRRLRVDVALPAAGAATRLDEHQVWIPSANFSVWPDRHVPQLPREVWHPVRILSRPWVGHRRLRRVYLAVNGLNETDNVGTYYRIAEMLFRREEEALGVPASESAVLLHPFPGHLMRHPFPGPWATKPLDRYQDDPGELFQHYLRYMMESQWLLSALTPFDDIELASGLNLTARKRRTDAGQLANMISLDALSLSGTPVPLYPGADDALLQKLLHVVLEHLDPSDPATMRRVFEEVASAPSESVRETISPDRRNEARAKILEAKQRAESQPGVAETAVPGWELQALESLLYACELMVAPNNRTLTENISDLRGILGWRAAEDVQEGQGPIESDCWPFVHALGYSLGGFVARSLFWVWPQVVATCTSLASGGHLDEVTLQRFAHADEWRGVLHKLRYAIDNDYLKRRIVASTLRGRGIDGQSVEEDRVLGMPVGYYSAFLRAFYEIFLQAFDVAYQTWASEFRDRLLFVVGGADDIVRADRVQMSAPPGGLNTISVASVSHALHDSDPEWHEFWLPEVVASAAMRLAHRKEQDVARVWARYWGKIA